MSAKKPVVIYGVTGYTGRLVAEYCREYNIPFIAAARDGKRAKEVLDKVPGIETADYEIVEVKEHSVAALNAIRLHPRAVGSGLGGGGQIRHHGANAFPDHLASDFVDVAHRRALRRNRRRVEAHQGHESTRPARCIDLRGHPGRGRACDVSPGRDRRAVVNQDDLVLVRGKALHVFRCDEVADQCRQIHWLAVAKI